MTTWRDYINLLYPDALHRTYCVPPVHFNRVSYVRETVAGTGLPALVLPVPFTPPVQNAPPASQPSGSAAPVHSVPPASQPSGSAAPVHSVPPASQPSGSAAPVHNIPPASQPYGSAAPVHNVPPVSQPSGSAAPVHNVPPVSQPSGSTTPVHNVPPASQPSGSAAPVHSVPPASQQSNPPAPYSLWTQESDPEATPVRVQESDFRDDTAQRHVLANLRALGNAGQEPMFILSQLNFGDYLNEPSYTAAVQASQLPYLPRPEDLGQKYAAGDFDILLIHRRYGILVGELKAVGRNQPGVSRTPAQADDDVAKRVGTAVKQQDQSVSVVSHLVSDIAPGLTVKKTLFLPYVGSAQLQRVLTANPQLEQVNTHTHTRTHARTLTHTYTHARTHARTHTHTRIYIHTRTHTHTHARTHARAYTNTHARARAHTRTHTRSPLPHTQTHTHARKHTETRANTHTHNLC